MEIVNKRKIRKSNQKMDKDKVVVEYTANSNLLGKSIEVKYLKI